MKEILRVDWLDVTERPGWHGAPAGGDGSEPLPEPTKVVEVGIKHSETKECLYLGKCYTNDPGFGEGYGSVTVIPKRLIVRRKVIHRFKP